MLAITAVALFIYTRGSRGPEEFTLEIPEGASLLIAAGENPLDIPKQWTFLADDTLTLINHDRVDHWFGTYLAPANHTFTYELQPAYAGTVFCSLHPTGSIVIDVDVRDFDWRLLLAPTLIFGPAIGLVVFGVSFVMGALGEEDELAQPSDSI